MKRYFSHTIIFFIVLCMCCNAMAQSTKSSDANIHGHIIDAATGQHIPFVTISIKGTTIGTVSDATGHYFLKNLPEGECVVIAESVGYQSIEQTVTLTRRKSVEANNKREMQLASPFLLHIQCYSAFSSVSLSCVL